MLGRRMSQESRRKISTSNKGMRNSLGFKHSEETKRRKSKNCRLKIPVLQYTKSGEFIQEWESIKSTKRLLGSKIGITHISGCCKYTRKTAYGFIWRFKHDPLLSG